VPGSRIDEAPESGWRRHFFVREEHVRTTWLFRALLLLTLALLVVSASMWKDEVARGLVCDEQAATSDGILLENFDPDYLVFQRATELVRAGAANRVLVPVPPGDGPGDVSRISTGVAELMASIARLPKMEFIRVDDREPITLNAARQLRDFMTRERITSVIVVTPALRSRRSQLVYSTVFSPAGIQVRCVPVFGAKTVDNWSDTWHGIQEVGLQFVKLQYYRFWVLL